MPSLTPIVITDEDAIDFVRPQHERWVNLVAAGKIVAIPCAGAESSTRNQINGALRSRGIKASVKRGTDNTGQPVFIVRLKPLAAVR